MNLRDLEYFVAVADLGHYRVAAESCFVSQPTLSGQLRKLEEELGSPLFERSTRRVSLTAFGREALFLARGILRDSAALVEAGRALQDPFRGPLSLGVFPTLCPWLLPRLTPLFRASYPATDFLLREERSLELEAGLREGRLDAAILALPQAQPGIETLALFSEPFLLALPAAHPLAARASIEVGELAGLELLLLEDGHCLRDQALDLCRRFGASEAGRLKATSLETLRQMVVLGVGITLMPRLAVPAHAEEGIAYVPISSPEARRDIGLSFRATHPRRAFLLDLAGRVRSSCGTLLPVEALGNG